MVVSSQTRGFYSFHLWCTLFMVLGYRLSPFMYTLPPSEILMLLFGVLMGEYKLDPWLLFEGPQSHWALPQSPDHVENLIFSSRLAQKIPESDIAVDQQYPQVLPTGTWLIPGNTARRARHRQVPGTLLAEVLLPQVSRTCLEVGSAEPASDLCHVHSSVLGATQLCFVLLVFLLSPL